MKTSFVKSQKDGGERLNETSRGISSELLVSRSKSREDSEVSNKDNLLGEWTSANNNNKNNAPNLKTDDATNAGEGMNIGIPATLQQPILTDEEGSQRRQNKIVGVETSLNAGGRNIKDAEYAEESAFQRLQKRHNRLNRLCMYETEAETALLAAIEEELNATEGRDVEGAIFPNFSFNDNLTAPRKQRNDNATPDDNKRAKLAPTRAQWQPLHDLGFATDDKRAKLAQTRAQWQALQHLGRGDEERLSSLTNSPGKHAKHGNGAADLFMQNASILMSAAKKGLNNSKLYKNEGEDDKDQREYGDTTRGVFNHNQSAIETNETEWNNENDGERTSQAGDQKAATNHEDIEKGKPRLWNNIADTAVHFPKTFKKRFNQNTDRIRAEWEALESVIEPQKASMKKSMRNQLFFLILPNLLIAAILYYGFDNPIGKGNASVSWWFIFVGIRQVITLSLARMTECLVASYMGVASMRFMSFTGPTIGLLISQSKGWPGILIFWGMYNFMLLAGNTKFARHWLGRQDFFELFSEENPAGQVTSAPAYLVFLSVCIGTGVVVGAKRLILGLYYGRGLYSRYHGNLVAVMEKMLLLSEVASLSVLKPKPITSGLKDMSVSGLQDSLSKTSDQNPQRFLETTIMPGIEILNLLEEWEEPEKIEKEMERASIAHIVEFRQSYVLMQTRYPFSALFGLADTRIACVDSATKLFQKLLKRQAESGIDSEKDVLIFDTLCEIATKRDGSVDGEKVRSLIRLLRPARDGRLTLFEFTKSVDTVYREIRTLSANISNSSAIDRAFEKIINSFFYTFLALIILACFGVDGLTFLLNFLGFVVALAFAIGPACSAFFEGMLLILVRKPYEIGDRVAVSDIQEDTNPSGSSGWIVENIDLFTTSMRYGSTREVATVSNGSLAKSRIINMNRSDKATVMVYLKFGVSVPYKKIQVFRRAVEAFIYERPREWMKSVAFRSTRVEADLGYIEYVLVLQSRYSWQRVGEVLENKANVSSYCLELQRQLDMRYIAPTVPMELNLKGNETFRDIKGLIEEDEEDVENKRDTNGDDGSTESAEESRILEAQRLFEPKKQR